MAVTGMQSKREELGVKDTKKKKKVLCKHEVRLREQSASRKL